MQCQQSISVAGCMDSRIPAAMTFLRSCVIQLADIYAFLRSLPQATPAKNIPLLNQEGVIQEQPKTLRWAR
jgi:hypothetical protein